MHLDSHQHFWKYNPTDYGWMADSMEVLRRDYLPAALEAKLWAIGFEGTVVVQARRMLAETEWLLDLADRHPFVRGVVGWVDFGSEHLDQQLERWRSHPKLKGVREVIHDMDDLEYAASDVHVRGVSRLTPLGLTYDLLLKPPHVRTAIELVRQLPEQRFVVDHLAKPHIAARELSPWREDIQALARFDNVCCKLSGMVTEAEWDRWKPDDFGPYLDVVLEAFGPERLMIGSDWPVCTLAGTYEDIMAIVIDYVARLSPAERDAILGGTCARFYRLGA